MFYILFIFVYFVDNKINTAFEVATGIFGADGIVIDIKGGFGSMSYWSCSSWSDFIEEVNLFFSDILSFKLQFFC